MQKLHLVGFTTDQTGLILSARRGARSGGYTLVVDDALVQAVEELRAVQEEEAAADGRSDRPESRLPISEIQARLRRGKSVKDVAKEAGVEPEWVERFAAPVFAERAEVISRVQSTFLKRARLGPSGVRIGDAVRRNLVERGVTMAPDEFADAWSTSQRPDGRWIVRFGFAYRGSHRTLKYEVRTNGEIVAGDPFTAQLSYIAPPKRPARPRPAPVKEPEAKRAATVGSGFRPEAPTVKKKATSRPAKERERAAAAMTKAAARRALEAERAAARKARERAQLQARREREARVEAQRREREARARAREAAAAARLAAAEQAERERRAAAEAAARQAERERARAQRERAREQARRAAAKKAAAKKTSAKKATAKKAPTKATTKKATTKKATTAAGKATPTTAKKAAAAKEAAPTTSRSGATAKKSPARTAAARKVVAQARAERARKAAIEARRTPAEPRPAEPSRPRSRRPASPPRPDQRVALPPPDGAARPTAAVDLRGPEATRALFRAGLAQPAGEPDSAGSADEAANGQAPRVRPPGFRRRRPLRAT